MRRPLDSYPGIGLTPCDANVRTGWPGEQLAMDVIVNADDLDTLSNIYEKVLERLLA